MTQYSDTTNQLGIVQQVHFLCGTTTTDYLIADITRSVNNYYDKLFTVQALKAGSRQPDDSNYATVSVISTNFTSGTRKFDLDANVLFIEHIEIQDQNGNYIILDRRDKANLTTAWGEQGDGVPRYYDEHGNYFELDKTPNYSGTAKIWVTRLPSLFAATDTTKTPGMPRVLHQYLAYGAAWDYCVRYKPQLAQEYAVQLQVFERLAERLTGKAKKIVKASVASREQTR